MAHRFRSRDQMRQGYEPITRLAASVMEKACRDRALWQDRWAKARSDGRTVAAGAVAAQLEEVDTFLMNDSLWHQILGIDPDILGERTHALSNAELNQAKLSIQSPGHRRRKEEAAAQANLQPQ